MPTALIVEDEPEANKLLGMLLRLRGYQTESAFNGRQALELVEKSPPDIIFLDLMLPDLNGYEVCKILKSSKGTSLIPLVIVTARIAAENRIESFCLGADDYIAKPYTPDQIFQALEQAVRWLDQSRAGADPGADRLRPRRRRRDPPPAGTASQPDLRPDRARPRRRSSRSAGPSRRSGAWPTSGPRVHLDDPIIVPGLHADRRLGSPWSFVSAARLALAGDPGLADDPSSSLHLAGFDRDPPRRAGIRSP